MTILKAILAFFLGSSAMLGATVLTTNSSDTLNTFRTNVNTSLDNLNTALGSLSGTISTSSPIAAGGAVLYATGVNTVASVATSSLAVGGSISSSGTLGYQIGGTNTTLSLNMANANTWTALQSFGNASTSYIGSTLGSWFATTGGNVGVGTTSPFAKFAINPIAGESVAFNIGSSTKSLFSINTNGQIETNSIQAATSTAITLDWNATPQQVEYRIGGSATTITLINATTSQKWGSVKRVWICNPGGTAGALTWAGVRWIGTAPTQTTTANKCDLYSFNVTMATSSTAYIVAGTQGAGL